MEKTTEPNQTRPRQIKCKRGPRQNLSGTRELKLCNSRPTYVKTSQNKWGRRANMDYSRACPTYSGRKTLDETADLEKRATAFCMCSGNDRAPEQHRGADLFDLISARHSLLAAKFQYAQPYAEWPRPVGNQRSVQSTASKHVGPSQASVEGMSLLTGRGLHNLNIANQIKILTCTIHRLLPFEQLNQPIIF